MQCFCSQWLSRNPHPRTQDMATAIVEDAEFAETFADIFPSRPMEEVIAEMERGKLLHTFWAHHTIRCEKPECACGKHTVREIDGHSSSDVL